MKKFDLILQDAMVVTPTGVIANGWVGVNGGRISAIERGLCVEEATAVRSVHGGWLGPGFIDVHTHGSAGISIAEASAKDLRELSRFFVRHGVTSFLAGISTRDQTQTKAALNTISSVVGRVSEGSNILGAYMEGPFLNPLRKGAHREDLLRAIDPAEVNLYLATPMVKAMVIAPELAHGSWLIEMLCTHDITAIGGHSNASFTQIQEARKAGLTAIAHTFNGMRGIHQREPGVVGAALLLDGLICEVIADGVHVAPELLNLIWKMKGPNQIALITDAGPFGGMADGTYIGTEFEIMVENGVGRLKDGTISGSAHTFDHNFRLFCSAIGVSFAEAWPTVSETPAKIAGVSDRKGSIRIGMDADLVILNSAGVVEASVVSGDWVSASK